MAKKTKVDNTFKITQFQPNDTVTSSSVFLEICDGTKILFDLGALQDSSKNFKQIFHSNMEKLNSIPFGEIDYICCLHYHFDHVGLLPVVARPDYEFKGEILATELTMEMAGHIMYDAQKINNIDASKQSMKDKKKYELYYTKENVDTILDIAKCYSYEQEIRLSENVTLEFLPASHVGGASMAYITYKDENKTKHFLYTSDFYYGDDEKPFTKSVMEKCLKVNTLVCESTYGLNDRKQSHDDTKDFLEKVILDEIVGKSSTVWIPTFACGRATTLYLYLYEIFQRNQAIKDANIPVYFCGKLMFNAHRTMGKDKYRCYYDEKWNDKHEIFYKEPFGFLTEKKDVEHFCYNNTRKIVLSSSGMWDAGYSAVLADSYIGNRKVSALSCGYQAEGSLGQRISLGEERVNVNGTSKKVRLNYLGCLPSLSGHSSYDGLISFVKSLNQSVLKDIILVHGSTESKVSFKQGLEKELSSNKKIHIIKQYETIKTDY